MRTLTRAVFFVIALPAVARAACRCAFLERRLPLDELVARLRAVGPFGFEALSRPRWLLAALDVMLPVLPPWRYGSCLKRSLLLLDLWSRCGLRPRLHLSVRREADGRSHQAHAWVTIDEAGSEGVAPVVRGRVPLATSSQGYPEAFVL
jgi:hypothetical protein